MIALHPQILIPIDFSEQSIIALEQSLRLATFYRAEITLIYVIEEGGGMLKLFSKGEQANEKEIEAKLADLAAISSKKYNIKINTVIAKGDMLEKILETADKIGAKFIIIGSYSSDDKLQKKTIGGSAIRIVKEAACPVITIKGKSNRAGCKNIVLPIDMTKESREKVKNAIDFAKLYGSTIRVVSILYHLDKDSAFRLSKQVEHVKHFITEAGVPCTVALLRDVQPKHTVADSIIEYADKIQADLIMIMTQQEDEMKPLFKDSAAHEIIDKSDIPVMSIVPTIKQSSGFSPY